MHLQAQLFVVDMEGLSDGRALKTILPQINPRKLVRPAPLPFVTALFADGRMTYRLSSMGPKTPSPT